MVKTPPTEPLHWLADTKFHPPLLRNDVIPRQRLLAVLHDALLSHPLTLLSAPAGYGKTTLLASLGQGDKERGRQGAKMVFSLSPPLPLSLSPPLLRPSAPLFLLWPVSESWPNLDDFLRRALTGQGRVTFVTGEAGSGKTALVQEFARWAEERQAELVTITGNCHALAGIGDPYLPFREILDLLTGGVETRWAAGLISQERTRRLWACMPLAIETLVKVGPDLIDVFVPGSALMSRAAANISGQAGWLAQLQQRLAGREAGQSAALEQSDLFAQYTRVLQALAREQSLLLILDDLQWADAGSISLLFHLGRRLEHSPILIIGIYRPTEVMLGRPSLSSGLVERHPLTTVVNEFQRQFGQIHLDLNQAEGRPFVEAFLDTEPNRLDAAFREALYRQTRGNPLFTIELLRGMQERGDLIQNKAGQWVAGTAVDWETLPTRVEGVIEERISRLAQPLRAALTVASVEGEEFTAEVVAQVQATPARETVRQLSRELDRRHRLVRGQGSRQLGAQRLSRYRFRHVLFQKYLYNSLDQAERTYLHEAVGKALESLYEGQPEAIAEIAEQLARHFQAAGQTFKAADYLRQAGDRAIRLSAHEQAIAYYKRGLMLLKNMPDTPERRRPELALQIALGRALMVVKGYSDPEVGQAFYRAYELGQQTGETRQLLLVVYALYAFNITQSKYPTALEFGRQYLQLTQRYQADHLVVAHRPLGYVYFCQGVLDQARAHFEHSVAHYDPQQHRALAFTHVAEPGMAGLSMLAMTLQLLGYPDQALQRCRESLAIARDLPHPFSLTYALFHAGAMPHQLRREVQAVREYAEEMMAICREHKFGLYLALGQIMWGWALAGQGQAEAGIAQIEAGLAGQEASNSRVFHPYFLGLLAEACRNAGRLDDGLAIVAKALAMVEETGERFYEAELHRLKGELLLMQDNEAEAEASFHKAIEVARKQEAKSWELRAVMSLCRLLQQQGRGEEGRQLLAEVYGWFTEGFDTPDLMEAKALLDALS